MPLRVECPICEHKFEIAGESSPTNSICPVCNRSFRTSIAIVATEEKPKREKLILPEQVLSPPVQPLRSAPQDFGNANDVPLPPDATCAEPDVPLKPMRRTFAKQPGKVFPLAIIGVLFVISVGLLIYLPYVINHSNKTDDQTLSQNPTQVDDPAVSVPTAAEELAVKRNAIRNATEKVMTGFRDAQNGTDLAGLNPPAPKRNPKQPPESNPEFFTQQQLEDCWREHHSRIVRLTIANGLGEKLALGTIVDSRGWILTSLRAIAGATQIRVTQSASSFEQFKTEDRLSDLVRGVLAVDVEHDLAILAINRRFVINFSDLKRSAEDAVADDEHLAQFGLIDEDTPLFLRETQVSGRPAMAGLDADAQKYFANAGLNSNSIVWITHSNALGIVGGAPLLTIDGKLVGMCPEQPAAKVGYAVPVTVLDELLKSIESDAKTDGGNSPLGLSVLNEHFKQIGEPALDPKIGVDVDNPYRDESVKLNQTGDRCSQFGWVPKNLEQYQLLQKFSQRWIAFNNTINGIPDDPDLPAATTNLANRATLQEQADRWAAELKSAFTPQPLPPDQVGDFNRLAAQAIQLANSDESQSDYFIAYVRVRLGAMDSPKPAAGEDTITLDIEQTDDIVIVPFDVLFPPMQPETLWLAIYGANDNRIINFVDPDTNENHEARFGKMAMVLGPLD